MTNLTNYDIATTYPDVITLGSATAGAGLTSTLVNVQDGNGVNSPMQISTTAVNFNTNTGNTFQFNGVALNATRLFDVIADAPNFSFSTTEMIIPVGTTAQRPLTPSDGAFRYNIDENLYEITDELGSWNKIAYLRNAMDITNFLSVFHNNVSGIVDFSWSTGTINLPSGTTGQRPNAPLVGTIRWNSTTSHWEGWDGATWRNFNVT